MSRPSAPPLNNGSTSGRVDSTFVSMTPPNGHKTDEVFDQGPLQRQPHPAHSQTWPPGFSVITPSSTTNGTPGHSNVRPQDTPNNENIPLPGDNTPRSPSPLPRAQRLPRRPRATAVPDPAPQNRSFRSRVRKFMILYRLATASKGGDHTQPLKQTLCEKCDKLDLCLQNFTTEKAETLSAAGNPRRSKRQGKQSMGTLQEIWNKSSRCPLCRLICKSLIEQDKGIAMIFEGTVNENIKQSETPKFDARCWLMWQLDGRETVDNGDGTTKDMRKTRRLRIGWHDKAYEEAHIVLVYPNDPDGPKPQFLGRLQTSLDVSKVEQIQNWYNLCLKHHETCFINHEKSERFQDLRQESYFGVIDLHDMCLKALPENACYAALSYTWGPELPGTSNVERFKTKLDNVEQLKLVDGVRRIRSDLPRTISDTIDLVKKLGIPYLWVDSLCILQGDDDIWALNADHMDTVYGNASLTICAADGSDAGAGLKALHPLPSIYEYHAKQYSENLDNGLQIIVAYPSETYIDRSAWNTRAWTFQERILSKRCLLFVEGRVYFQCRSSTMSEDIHCEESQKGWSQELLHGPLRVYKDLDKEPVRVYKYSVELYTNRILSKPGDVLAAFGGIGKEICNRLGANSIFGLPNSHFDFALLWKPEKGPTRRYKDGKLKFPSWSWCGWMDTTISYPKAFTSGCEPNLNEWLTRHTWINWYIRDGQGNLRLVWDASLDKNTGASLPNNTWRGYGRVSTTDSTDSAKKNNDLDVNADRYDRKLDTSIIGQKRHKFTRTMPRYPYQIRMVEPGRRSTHSDDYSPDRRQDERFLQFWTWSAYFTLQIEEDAEQNPSQGRDDDRSLVRYWIINGDGDHIGIITLQADDQHLTEDFKEYEFIAISDAKGFLKEEIPDWTFIEPAHEDSAEWYAYNVLLLADDEEITGVKRRAGLGKIFKRGFDNPCPGPEGKYKEWKEIILG